MNIMVVDDGVDVADILAVVLRKLGGTVQVAYQAREALQMGEALQPDLIFLDIGLPDLSGYDACKEMRYTAWGANTYIVALTGRNEPEDLIRTAHTGFDRHVAKPIGMDTVKEILRTVKTKMTFNDPHGSSSSDSMTFM